MRDTPNDPNLTTGTVINRYGFEESYPFVREPYEADETAAAGDYPPQDEHEDRAYCAAGEAMEHNPEPSIPRG